MIQDFSPYPHISSDKALHNGTLFPVPKLCDLCKSRECATAFDSKPSAEPTKCIQGVYFHCVTDCTKRRIVVIGFLYERSELPDFNKQFRQNVYRLKTSDLGRLAEIFSSGGLMTEAIRTYHARNESRALHDLKHLIAAMCRKVERHDVSLAIDANKNGPASLLSKTVLDVYHLLGSVRDHVKLNDFVIAPHAFNNEGEIELDVFGLFSKSSTIYNTLAEMSERRITFSRGNDSFMRANRRVKEIFVLLPAILLQNAIKYSKGENIEVIFNLRSEIIDVCVKSYGVLVPASEREDIFLEGHQYIHSADTSKGGSGLGLFLARRICELNHFTLSYEADLPSGEDTKLHLGWNCFRVREMAGPFASKKLLELREKLTN